MSLVSKSLKEVIETLEFIRDNQEEIICDDEDDSCICNDFDLTIDTIRDLIDTFDLTYKCEEIELEQLKGNEDKCK